jgi:hypothetical protein
MTVEQGWRFTTAKIAAAMGGATRLTAGLAAALCAAALSACGGGGDSTATTAADATGAEAPSNSGGGQQGSSKKGGGQQGSSNGSGGKGNGGGSNGGNAGGNFRFTGEPVKHDHQKPVEGKRSDIFRTPGGDNSIQEYGEETDADERAAAMLPIAALHRAMFSGDWTDVCDTYLFSSNLEQLTALAEKAPQFKGKDCAAVLAGLSQATGAKAPSTPDGALVSFRVDGDTGFAIYWGIDGKGYAFALKSEDGGWKLTSLGPTPLAPGA